MVLIVTFSLHIVKRGYVTNVANVSAVILGIQYRICSRPNWYGVPRIPHLIT